MRCVKLTLELPHPKPNARTRTHTHLEGIHTPRLGGTGTPEVEPTDYELSRRGRIVVG